MECLEGAWTEEEKRDYEKMRVKEADSIYNTENIPVNDPEKRASFLLRKKDFPSQTQDDAREILGKDGKAAALSFLEGISVGNNLYLN